MLRIFIVTALLVTGFGLKAQTVTTVNDGPWNVAATWSSNPVIPNAFNSDSIIVMHNVTVPSGFNVTIDGTRIINGRSLTVQSGGTLTLAAVTTALRVQGTLVGANASTITGSNGTNISFSGGSTYRHEFTTAQGVIPRGVWSTGSTLEVTGYTSFATASAAGNWNQTFGNVTWNCPLQHNIFSLSGLLTSVTGSLNLLSTGSSAFSFASSGNPIVNITQDFNVGGSSRLVIITTPSSSPGMVLNIGRDFNVTTTNSIPSTFNASGLTTVNVARDFSMNSAAAILRMGSASTTSIGVLNVGRNFSLQAGTITEAAPDPGYGEIVFSGASGTQHTFLNTGTINNTIHYTVAANNTLTVLGESALAGTTNSLLTVNGTLRLQSTSAAGAIQNGVSGGGNVKVVNRVYNTGSTIVYGGSGAQFIGNGHPSTLNTLAVIDNAAGVSLAANTTMGNMQVLNGNLDQQNFLLTVNGTLELIGGNVLITTTSSPKSITVNGLFAANGGRLQITSGAAGAIVNINGTVSGANGFNSTGTNTILNFGGTGNLGADFPFSGTQSINELNVNRGGNGTVSFSTVLTTVDVNVVNGNLDVNNRLVVTDDVNISTGTTLLFEDAVLDMRSQFNNITSGGQLSSNAGSILLVNGTGILGTLVFSGSGNTLGTFTMNRATGGTLVTLNSPLSIATIFDLRRGIFLNTSGLTMNAGSMFRRNSQGTLNGAIPAGGPYDLDYTNTTLTTGPEGQGSLSNVTINVTGTVTLGTPITASGSLSVNTGTLSSGANAISVATVTNSSVFVAPSSTLTLTGNFTNTGTFNGNNGTTIFNGTSSISGTPLFHHVTIAQTLVGNLNLGGNFTNNGTYNPLGGEVRFAGSAIQNISGSTLTNFFDIRITNTTSPVSVSVQSNQNLIGTLTLGTNAKLDADGSGNTSVFTLISTNDSPVQDARIATLPAGASVLGEVTAQRYMSVEGKGSRYISIPVSPVAVTELQDDFAVTGSFTGTSFPCTGCTNNGTSLRWYNESIPGANNVGYRQTPASNASENLEVGRGYYAYMWNGALQVTWDTRGVINSGNIALPVSHTPSSPVQPNADGWNLVGNPYPSAIAWDGGAGWIFSNESDFGPTISVPDIMGGDTKNYNYVDDSGDLPGGVIAMGQAFWVYTYTPGSSLTITEQAKVANSGSFYRKANTKSSQLIVELNHNGLKDRSFLKVNPEATDAFDKSFDTYKFKNEHFSISLADKTGNELMMHTVKELAESSLVPLHLEVSEPGDYAIKFPEHDKFTYTDLYLIDTEENVSEKIVDNFSYTFKISDTQPVLNRFYVSMNSKMPEEKNLEPTVEAYPNPVHDVLTIRVGTREAANVTMLSSSGQVFFNSTVQGETSVDMKKLPDGLYILKVQSFGNVVIRKILKSQTTSVK